MNDQSVPDPERAGDDDEAEEGRPIKGQKATYVPNREDWDSHMRSHIPFRRWCPFCVKGRSKSRAHRKLQKTDEEKDREVPVMSFDYMEPRSAEGKRAKVESLPILAMIDRRTKWHAAIMVRASGLNGYAVAAAVREIELSGYNRMILKSDQGPDILNLLKAVKRERQESIEMQPEEAPVGEHQSNGDVERSVQSLEGQMRSMKMALESRYKMKIKEDHPIYPWLIMHAAILINVCKVNDDGRTAYEARKGKLSTKHRPR